MASRAEQLRRLEQGENARARVLQRLAQPQEQSSGISPRAAAIQNHDTAMKEHEATVRLNAQEQRLDRLQNQTVASPSMDSRMKNEPQDIGASIKRFQAENPVKIQEPSSNAEWLEQQKQHRQQLNPELYDGKGFGDVVTKYVGEPFAQLMDRIQTVPGLSNFQQGAANAIGSEANTAPKLDGLAGKVANIAGNIAGYSVNPTALEQNLVTGGYKAANAAVDAARASSPRAAALLSGKLNERVITGGIAGASQNTALEMAKGNTDAKDIINAAVSGAAFGGAADGTMHLLGQGAKALMPSLNKGIKAAGGAVNELGNVATGGPNSGFALGRKVGAYDNLKTDTKSQLVTKTKRETRSAKGWMDRLYTSLVDDIHPLNRFDKNTETAIGRKLSTEESVHKNALSTRGADVVSNQILTNGLVDSAGNIIGKSLKERLATIPKGKFVDFEDYLVNKHALTRAERGEQVFRDDLQWTPEKGSQILAGYDERYPQFAEAAKDIYDFQNTMLQKWLVEPGIITKEQAAAYLEANPFYVPMKRQFSELEKTGTGFRTKKGFSGQSNPNKKYSKVGSQRKIISPIESMIENVDSFVKASKRNDVMKTFVDNLQKAPDDLRPFAEIVNQPPKLDNIKNVDMTSPEGLEEVLARMTEDFDRVMQRTKLDKDNIVRVLVNGEPVHVKINDKHLLEAVTALGPQTGSKLLDAIGWLTNKMKVLTTGANPMFSLTRNVVRDIPQAYIASKSTNNPLRFVADLADAAWSIARNKELYQQFKNMGGGHSSSVAADRNLLAQSKRAILPQSKFTLRAAVPRAYGKLENLMNYVESAPRLAEFKRLSKAGDSAKGLFESQDITVNFKRKGKLTRDLDKVFPYFNAAVQGLDKFARIYKDNPAQAILKSFAALTVPTAVFYAINHDDPDYQKLSNHVKDNFLLWPKGDGTFIKIAKPREIGTFWSDIPERLLRQFKEQDPEAFKGFAEQIRTSFTLPGLQGLLKTGGITQRLSGALGDTILGPIADIQANKNYNDSPIVPGYLENLSPELQSDARTSSLSKRIGEATGTSPKELDYLLRQYTGVIGQVGLPMLTPGSGNNPLQSLGNSFEQQVSADPVYTNEIMDKFYKNKGKYDQANTDSTVTGKLPKWYSDSTRKALGRYGKQISEIRKDMRVVENDKTLSAEKKRQQLRMMQDKMNSIAVEANKLVP